MPCIFSDAPADHRLKDFFKMRNSRAGGNTGSSPTISSIVENVGGFVFLRLRFLSAVWHPLITQSLRPFDEIHRTEERFKDDAPQLHQGLRFSHGC
jgi:hypothetical protein